MPPIVQVCFAPALGGQDTQEYLVTHENRCLLYPIPGIAKLAHHWHTDSAVAAPTAGRPRIRAFGARQVRRVTAGAGRGRRKTSWL